MAFWLLFVVSKYVLAYFIHVARADGEHDVARFKRLAQGGLKPVKGREEARAVYLRGKIRGRDTDGVFLARGVYLREEEDIGGA